MHKIENGAKKPLSLRKRLYNVHVRSRIYKERVRVYACARIISLLLVLWLSEQLS